MIDDAKIRLMVLEAFPQIEPHRIEIEELDFGEVIGIWYRGGDNLITRVKTETRGKDEKDIAANLIELLSLRLTPPVLVAQAPVTNYQGKRGRHPHDCICDTCIKRRQTVSA